MNISRQQYKYIKTKPRLKYEYIKILRTSKSKGIESL